MAVRTFSFDPTPAGGATTTAPTPTPRREVNFRFGGQYLQDTGDPTKLATTTRGYGGVQTRQGYQRDHYFPLSLGGTSNKENIIPLEMDKALQKDKVALYALKQFRAGKITLPQARLMVLNWENTDVPGQKALNKRFGGDQNVASNFLKELPRQTLNVAKTILQSIGYNIASTGAEVSDALLPGTPYAEMKLPPALQKVFGQPTLKSLSTRIAQGELAIKDSPFAQRYGFDKHALPLAFGGVVGSAALDLTGYGGEKNVIKLLVKETDPVAVARVLRKLGVAEEVVTEFAPKIANAVSDAEVSDALKVMQGANGLKAAEQALQPSARDALIMQRDILRETIAAHPARRLSRFANHRTGELPEVLGEGGKFGTMGDDIVTEVGYRDSEEARASYQEYLKLKSRLTQLDEEIKLTPVRDTTGTGETAIRAGTQSETSSLEKFVRSLPNEEVQALKPIVDEALPAVKQKVNIVDYLATPEFVLERIGLGKEAKALHDAYDGYRREVKEELGKVIEWFERVKDIPDASRQIFRYLDGQKVELEGKELEVAEEMKAYLAQWADRLGLPQDNRVSHYITHIFERDFVQKEFDPDLAKLIEDRIPGSVYDPFLEKRLGKLGYVEDAFAALDAYVKRATRKVNMDPALEGLKRAGDLLDTESHKYIMRLAHRINLRPTEVDNLIDNFIKSTVGYRFGVRPVASLSKSLRQVIYRGTLGLNIGSAVKNLTQGANTYAKLGERDTVIGYTKLFSRLLTNNLDELYSVGVLDDSIIQDRKIGVYKSLLQKMDTGLFLMFDLAEKINRGAAYYGAKAKYYRANTRTVGDGAQVISKDFSEEKAIEYAKRIVRETQFAFGSVDSPVILGSDVAKTVGQLQTFSVKQAEFLARMIKNKELAGLLRWTGASLAMVYTVGRVFGMSPKDLIPTFRLGGSPLGNAFSTLLGLVSPDQEKRDEAQRNIGANAAAFVPAGVQARKTYQGLNVVSQGADFTPSGRTRYEVEQTPANYLRAGIFGKRSLPEAQEYYRGLNEKDDTATKTSTPATSEKKIKSFSF